MVEEERPDASEADSGAPDVIPAVAEANDVDAQELLKAATRAIAAVRRHAAELFRDRRPHGGEEDEQAGAEPSSD